MRTDRNFDPSIRYLQHTTLGITSFCIEQPIPGDEMLKNGTKRALGKKSRTILKWKTKNALVCVRKKDNLIAQCSNESPS